MSDGVIADTGFVAAVANQKDKAHKICKEIYLKQAIINLPYTTLAEVGYYLQKFGNNYSAANFIRALPRTHYRLVTFEEQDFLRTAEILEVYADAKLDFVDATIVALAERMNITRILTVDRRDFGMIRPKHTAYFEILP